MNKNKKNTLIGTGTLFAALAVLGGTVLEKKLRKNKQEQEIVKDDKYKTGNIRRFGTLYLSGVKQKCPTYLAKNENIYQYMGEKIEIRNTDKSDETIKSELLKEGIKITSLSDYSSIKDSHKFIINYSNLDMKILRKSLLIISGII